MTAVMEQRPPAMLSAAAGDASSFSQLIEPLLDPAFRLAAVMLADRAAAEDAVQEASIKAWRKFRQLRGDERSLRSWFLSIVANECRMARRQRWWSVVRLAEPPRVEDTTDHYGGAAGDVRRAMLRLKPEDRLPLVLAVILPWLVEAPERKGPVWIAGMAAVLIAAMAVGALFIAGPLRQQNQQPLPAGLATPTPSALPTSDVSSLPAITCNNATSVATEGHVAQPTAYVTAVRTGTHTGYDRITIQFQNGLPEDIQIARQSNANFTQGASGRPVVLQGSAGLLITMHGADNHTQYTGAVDFKTGYPVLLESQQVQDFEGVVQWGLDLTVDGGIKNPGEFGLELKKITGVVEHGLFVGMADTVIVAGPEGPKAVGRLSGGAVA